MIAMEKGLLKFEDFEHIQKVIEVYSKVLLYDLRKKHRFERMKTFKNSDWSGYV